MPSGNGICEIAVSSIRRPPWRRWAVSFYTPVFVGIARCEIYVDPTAMRAYGLLARWHPVELPPKLYSPRKRVIFLSLRLRAVKRHERCFGTTLILLLSEVIGVWPLVYGHAAGLLLIRRQAKVFLPFAG